MRTLRHALLPLLLTLAACEPPPVYRTEDERGKPQLGRIEGSVVVQSTARGNVIVLLYDANHPPPPAGSGRPLSFAVLPAAEVFHTALYEDPAQRSAGPFTTSFAFDMVPVGRYLLRGFVDNDSCTTGATLCRKSDWKPFYGVTGEPNAGDVGGGAVDPVTLAPRIIEVPGTVGEDGVVRGQPVTGITVSYSDTARIPLERPVFKAEPVNGESHVFVNAVTSPETQKLLTLRAHSVMSPDVKTNVLPMPPRFFLQLMDNNKDGVPDDANGDRVADVWPMVVLRKLTDTSDSPIIEENDLNRDGLIDEDGVEYEPLQGEKDGIPDKVVLYAGFHPNTIQTKLFGSDGKPIWTPVPVDALPLAIRAQAFDTADPTRPPVMLKGVPPGRYAIILVNVTGQTWRVPNELMPTYARQVKLPEDESQSFYLQVPRN